MDGLVCIPSSKTYWRWIGPFLFFLSDEKGSAKSESTLAELENIDDECDQKVNKATQHVYLGVEAEERV